MPTRDLPSGVWKDVDLAYFAGLLDGEGSFCILPRYYGADRRLSTPFTRISFSSTTIELLDWVSSRFGGIVNVHVQEGARYTNCAPAWQWRQKRKKDLLRILPALIPYLVLKQPQARLMLYALTRFEKHGWNFAKTSPEQQQIRQQFCELSAALNSRGIGSSQVKAEARSEVEQLLADLG